ncbi:MAG: 50S ribosomal protein L25 [Myxococcota bacterium]
MSDFQLAVESRTSTGKGYTRKLRASGRVPGVCYSPTQEATSIEFDPTVLETMLRKSAAGLNTLIDLSGGGLDGQVVLVKELQRDPVRGDLLHADLYAIDVNKAIQVSVRVQVTGTATGVALDGGILDMVLREIEVNCLPRAIPEELPVDVTELALGDSIHIRDIPLPEGIELVSDPDLTVVSVAAPAKAESEAAAEEIAEDEAGAEAAAPAEGGGEKSEGGDDS